MRLTIQIELEERDMPLYGERIKHALSGLLHEAHNRDLAGKYVYTFPALDFGRVAESKTVVTVSQDDDFER